MKGLCRLLPVYQLSSLPARGSLPSVFLDSDPKHRSLKTVLLQTLASAKVAHDIYDLSVQFRDISHLEVSDFLAQLGLCGFSHPLFWQHSLHLRIRGCCGLKSTGQIYIYFLCLCVKGHTFVSEKGFCRSTTEQWSVEAIALFFTAFVSPLNPS